MQELSKSSKQISDVYLEETKITVSQSLNKVARYQKTYQTIGEDFIPLGSNLQAPS